MFLGAAAPAVGFEFPLIENLSSRDPLFQQQQDSVSRFYRAHRQGAAPPHLMLYRYRPNSGDTLISLASRFSIPYSALATLNRIEGSQLPKDIDTILVPSVPGLFVPTEAESSLEVMLSDRVEDDLDEADAITIRVARENKTKEFAFFPGEDFTADERRAFLNVLFRPPVEGMRLTSGFGFRRHPFTGGNSFHAGIDLGAPRGTPVYAAASGRVVEARRSAIYGRYVVLEHNNGYETLYGHLDSIEVQLNEHVSSGMIIGTVGSSGLTTGPHLHFEVRLHGRPRDPFHLLPGPSR